MDWIYLDKISFSYGDRKILDGLTLRVQKKEHIGIVGGSGNGKSTLLKILSGLYEVQEGSCIVAGEKNPALIRKQIAMVMQSPFLLPMSIRENITCGHPMAEETIWNAVRAAQLEEWVSRLPEGLDSQVGERGSKISGGQAQRLAIARAIAKDAPVILLDEPTSALDGQTATALMDALEALTEGKTVIHVTHREETLSGCNRILLLKGGRLYDKESGEPV